MKKGKRYIPRRCVSKPVHPGVQVGVGGRVVIECYGGRGRGIGRRNDVGAGGDMATHRAVGSDASD
jgi:hypothetical protein